MPVIVSRAWEDRAVNHGLHHHWDPGLGVLYCGWTGLHRTGVKPDRCEGCGGDSIKEAAPQHIAALLFGEEAQLRALAEEAAELAAAVCRYLNGKGDGAAVLEEVVGTRSVMESLRFLSLRGAGNMAAIEARQTERLWATINARRTTVVNGGEQA